MSIPCRIIKTARFIYHIGLLLSQKMKLSVESVPGLAGMFTDSQVL